ncbi:MAG: crossover junction endodeoxyribonuclease RuvC [Candidatus Amulumruptor caecigallinarius]|nr:crossover junction endodeoxyribonuclease RuvC [Candidatus Amulumruptor caecigallinarius]
MDEDLKKYDRIVMGIDPGTNVMGYGVIGLVGKKMEVVVLGAIQLSRFENHYKRLHRIFERVSGLAAQYLPDEVALEAPFFGKNVQSMLKLGRAQGVAMAAVLTRDIPIAEYAPRSIKMAVTGNGQASKEQVATMLRHILKIDEERIPKFLDATDALAVALTHIYETGKPVKAASAKSWADFLSRNPDRIATRRLPGTKPEMEP